ncbi:MAG: DUF2207 domain-containing protein [bacterium]|nr:DUF2207 domain-containing protein [bacterium]
MSRRILSVLTLCYIFLFLPQQVFAITQDEVKSFHADIVINQDTSLSITETIVYQTNLQKHGIYRYIPMTYNQGGQREVLPIRDISVSDLAGEPMPFTQSGNGIFRTLKIGDPETTFTGSKTYVLRYRVDRGVRSFPDHTELYWDITGEGWQIPVLKSSARVTSEFAQPSTAACFSGKFGSDDGLCEFSLSPSAADFKYPETINYGDSFTILLTLPKESNLLFPSQTDLILLWIRYNWILLLTPLPLLVMIIWWFRSGRDWQFVSPNVFLLDDDQPKQRRPMGLFAREPFVYEPHKALTPGEAGALLRELVYPNCIVAEIVALAQKKYIAISVHEEKGFLSTNRIYTFKKVAQSNTGLFGAQKILFDDLFASGDEVTSEKLKGTFYLTMAAANEAITASLVEKNVFSSNPNPARAKGMGVWIILCLLIGFGISTTYLNIGIIWPVFLLVAQIPFCFLLALNLAQKTAVGTNLWLQARGLRKSIKYGKWREEIKEKRLFIDEVLPFAVALGVVDRLSKDMQDLGIEPPTYLQSPGALGWSVADWANDFSSSAGSTLSYNPSSSSSSGGSGSSGGSSGSGGGGGGGGSW